MGTKRIPGQFDCYDKIGPNEPFFVLRANDSAASITVRNWADSYFRHHTLISPTGALPMKAAEKYREALACAEAMEEWYKENK